MAERMVACGWLAASAAAIFMIAMALFVPGGGALMLVYFGGAAALFALAYGIYRRSRVCAALAMINHLLGVVALLVQSRAAPPIQIAIALLLGVLYVLGAIGTFVHHARQRPDGRLARDAY